MFVLLPGVCSAAQEALYKAAQSSNPELCPTAAMVNATMDAHAKCSDGSAVTALKILRDMRTHVRLDTISYNTVINCFAKCRDGSATAAMGVFTEMRQHGISPNTVTYHSLVDAQARQTDGSAQDTQRILEEMMRPGNPGAALPDLSIFTTAINMQAKCRDGSGVSALQLLSLMKQNGVSPTAVTLNSVIDAQAKQKDGKARVALTILDAMRQSQIAEVRPTVVTYTSVIDCQAKCADGEGRTAVALMEEMVTEGLQPNHMTYGCCINAQAKRGNAKVASMLLEKMLASGLRPSHAQYNAVLDAHARCSDGSAIEALLVLDSMRQRGTQPNVISYSACIDAQAKREDGSAEIAVQLLEELLEKQIRPEMVTFAAAIEAQAKRKDGSPEHAAVILEGMSAYIKPNQVHYNSVLNACANKRPSAINVAERIFGLMQAKGFYPNIYTVSALLRAAGFSDPSRPDLARKWFIAYCTAENRTTPIVETNDHIVRALRISLTDDQAAELLTRAPGGAPPMRRSASGHSGMGYSDGTSPTVRRISRPSQSGFAALGENPPIRRIQRASDVGIGSEEPRRIHRPSQSSSNWRDSKNIPDGPSSKLFNAPTTAATPKPVAADGFGTSDWRNSPTPQSPRHFSTTSPRQGSAQDLLSAESAFGQQMPVRRSSQQMDPGAGWMRQRKTSPTPSRGHSPTPSPRGLSPTIPRRTGSNSLGMDSGVPSDRPVSQTGRRGSAINLARASQSFEQPQSPGLSPMSISLAAAKLPPPGLSGLLPSNGAQSPLIGGSMSLPPPGLSPRLPPPGLSPASFGASSGSQGKRPSPLPPPGLSPGPGTPLSWSTPGSPITVSEPADTDLLLLSEKMLSLQNSRRRESGADSPLSMEYSCLGLGASPLAHLAAQSLGADVSNLQSLLNPGKSPIPRASLDVSGLQTLFSPDDFLMAPAKRGTKTPTSNSSFVREPDGPDGTKGFGGRRLSSINMQPSAPAEHTGNATGAVLSSLPSGLTTPGTPLTPPPGLSPKPVQMAERAVDNATELAKAESAKAEAAKEAAAKADAAKTAAAVAEAAKEEASRIAKAAADANAEAQQKAADAKVKSEKEAADLQAKSEKEAADAKAKSEKEAADAKATKEAAAKNQAEKEAAKQAAEAKAKSEKENQQRLAAEKKTRVVKEEAAAAKARAKKDAADAKAKAEKSAAEAKAKDAKKAKAERAKIEQANIEKATRNIETSKAAVEKASEATAKAEKANAARVAEEAKAKAKADKEASAKKAVNAGSQKEAAAVKVADKSNSAKSKPDPKKADLPKASKQKGGCTDKKKGTSAGTATVAKATNLPIMLIAIPMLLAVVAWLLA